MKACPPQGLKVRDLLCEFQTFHSGSASAMDVGYLSQNLVPAGNFCRVESAQKFVAPEKAVATEFRRRQETLLNVEVKGSKGDAQERRGVFGAHELRFDGPGRSLLNGFLSVRKSPHSCRHHKGRARARGS